MPPKRVTVNQVLTQIFHGDENILESDENIVKIVKKDKQLSGIPRRRSVEEVLTDLWAEDSDNEIFNNLDVSVSGDPRQNSYMAGEQFHAPSFGDEEFQIPPILPEDSLPFSSALNDSSGFETCQSLDSIFTNEQGSVQPKFPPQNIDIPDITETNLQHNVVPSSSYLPMDQSLHSRNMLGEDGSLSGSNQTSPLRDGSSNSEDSDDLPLSKLATGLKKPAAAPSLGRKPKAAKKKNKKKKKDPNEPQKPVSAYALFFRDTQAAIKGQNQNATFGEVSKIVASMWDSLDPDSKESYKKRTETAKKLYLQKLAAYRASLVSQQSPLDIIDRQRERLINTTPIPQAIGQLKKYPLRTRPNKVMSPSSSSASSSPEHSLSPPHMSPQHNNDLSSLKDYHGNHIHSPEHAGRPHNLCTRNGCQNIAVCNTGWDNEYCSNECVVSHCRDVFTAWVVSRQQSANNYMQVN